jgi:superfamily II DNA or RNA helicase
MNLYPHQQKFIDDNPSGAILCWETGTGKTHAAKLWLEGRKEQAVVICPKQIKKDWSGDWDTYTFEEFKKASNNSELPSNPSAIVVDEADMMASSLFIARERSQRTEALYDYILSNPDTDVLLLSATPVRSKPSNMHTLLVLSRIKPATKECWLKYRSIYYELQHKPYLPRPAWLPKPGWQKMMPELINKYTYTALMQDIVDLPPETHDIIKLKQPNYEDNEAWEPAKQFAEDHRLEQGAKDKKIKELSRGYRKVVVVARYTQQIDELQKKLSQERETFVLDGRTRDVAKVVADAEASGECYLIVQAQVGAGFELPSFAVMIFASQSYGARDYVQMKGRTKRINALKPLKYYYLLAGRCDKMIYNAVQKGQDFIPSAYLRKTTQENE